MEQKFFPLPKTDRARKGSELVWKEKGEAGKKQKEADLQELASLFEKAARQAVKTLGVWERLRLDSVVQRLSPILGGRETGYRLSFKASRLKRVDFNLTENDFDSFDVPNKGAIKMALARRFYYTRTQKGKKFDIEKYREKEVKKRIKETHFLGLAKAVERSFDVFTGERRIETITKKIFSVRLSPNALTANVLAGVLSGDRKRNGAEETLERALRKIKSPAEISKSLDETAAASFRKKSP